MFRAKFSFQSQLLIASFSLPAVLVVAFLAVGPRAVADDYSWIGGSSQAWTDPMNWVNPNEPVSVTYPGADDVALFANAAAISLEGGQSVNTADVREVVSFTNGTLQVNGFNLMRVGAGAAGSLDLLSGTNINGNGTLAGVDADGKIWVHGGSTLHDGNEISIGYTSTGLLEVVDGGMATSDGPVFVGGFANGDGDVVVSDTGSMLSANTFIVVGNLGNGSLIASSGGNVQSTGNFEIGGFASGTGQVNIFDSGTTLSAGQQLVVGNSGVGLINISGGATATAHGALIGSSSGSQGNVYIQQSNSKLDVIGSPLTIGALGQGLLDITAGGQVNVQGAAVNVGASGSGNGTLRVEEAGSKLVIANGPLEVGQQGKGDLHVTQQGSIDAHELKMGSGGGQQSTGMIDGVGSFVQAHEMAIIGTQGKATLSISSGGELRSESGYIGNGGEGSVVISGSGSKWQLASQGFSVGDSTKGTLTLQNGGAISLGTPVRVGFTATGDGYLYLDGAGSQLGANRVEVGVSGHGMFNIRNGASVSDLDVELATSSNSEGTLIVDNAHLNGSSSFVNVGGFQGGTGTFKVQNNGQVDATVHIRKGEVQVTSGGQLTTSQLVVATEDSESGQVTVQGAGSHLQAGSEIALGTLGDAHLLVQDGGSVNAVGIRLRTGVHATSAGSIRVRTAGTVTANEIRMDSSSATLEVSGGGYLKANSTLELGTGTLQLVGGRIDVGDVLPLFSQVDFVNVGINGHFSAGSAVPNLHNYFGEVHVGGSPGTLTVGGAYLQDAGSTTSFSIAGTQAGSEYSQLVVGGDLQLSGKLTFSFENAFAPQAGQTFDLITVGGTSQLTDYQIEIKNLAPGFQYSFAPIEGGYQLTALSNGVFSPAIPGDFSGNGVVDSADYVVWREHLDTTFGQADYNAWQSHFGQTTTVGAAVAVPEVPFGNLLVVLGFLMKLGCRARREEERSKRAMSEFVIRHFFYI